MSIVWLWAPCGGRRVVELPQEPKLREETAWGGVGLREPLGSGAPEAALLRDERSHVLPAGARVAVADLLQLPHLAQLPGSLPSLLHMQLPRLSYPLRAEGGGRGRGEVGGGGHPAP